MTVELDPDFISAAWHKLLVNAVVGLMVLTGRRSGMFRRDDVAALARRYLAECLAVARADGANLGDGVADEIVGMLRQAPPDITTSMLTDREAHRPLEWDIRNGVIARKARTGDPVSDVLVPCWRRQAPARHCRLVCMAMYPCERVPDYVDRAPFRFVSTVDLAITPEQVFEVLADETSGRSGRR